SAYATTLKKGAVVTTSRDASRAARAFKRAVQGALNASAIDVVDLEAQPLPVARFQTARSECSGGVALRTTAGDPQSIDIVFLDERGADLSQAAARKLERVFSRQEYRRTFPGEIAELSYPPRVVESYATELLQSVDMTGVREAGAGTWSPSSPGPWTALPCSRCCSGWSRAPGSRSARSMPGSPGRICSSGRCLPRGRRRAASCAPWWRPRPAGHSTSPTACG